MRGRAAPSDDPLRRGALADCALLCLHDRHLSDTCYMHQHMRLLACICALADTQPATCSSQSCQKRLCGSSSICAPPSWPQLGTQGRGVAYLLQQRRCCRAVRRQRTPWRGNGLGDAGARWAALRCLWHRKSLQHKQDIAVCMLLVQLGCCNVGSTAGSKPCHLLPDLCMCDTTCGQCSHIGTASSRRQSGRLCEPEHSPAPQLHRLGQAGLRCW